MDVSFCVSGGGLGERSRAARLLFGRWGSGWGWSGGGGEGAAWANIRSAKAASQAAAAMAMAAGDCLWEPLAAAGEGAVFLFVYHLLGVAW